MVLLDIKSGQYYALDAVAGRIWQLSDGTRSVQDIADAVRAEFDGAGPDIDADVAAFVAEFVSESLLV